jgi:hypothetical protein
MLNLNTGITTSSSRVESDRDVLPFPTGGVFGPGRVTASPNKTDRKSSSDDVMNLARSIESELDNLQQGLNRLTVEIEEDEARDALASIPFRRFQNTSAPDSPPPAA